MNTFTLDTTVQTMVINGKVYKLVPEEEYQPAMVTDADIKEFAKTFELCTVRDDQNFVTDHYTRFSTDSLTLDNPIAKAMLDQYIDQAVADEFLMVHLVETDSHYWSWAICSAWDFNHDGYIDLLEYSPKFKKAWDEELARRVADEIWAIDFDEEEEE